MNLYKLLEFYVLLVAMIFKHFKFVSNKNTKNNRNDFSKNNYFIFFTMLPIIFISGFRHNMGTDYTSYQYIYQNVISQNSFIQLLSSGGEVGFSIFQKIVGVVSGYNIIFLMCILSFIIIAVYIYIFKKYSDSLWLSLIMLLSIGSYFTSFNTTRNFLACTLFLLTLRFVWSRNFLKYLISILLIASIHKSLLLMIPFYWLLNFNWKSKNNFVISICLFIFFLIGIIFSERISIILSDLIFNSYSIGNLDSFINGEVTNSVTTLIRYIFFIFMSIFNKENVNINKYEDRTYVNSLVFATLFAIVSLKIYIAYRFTYFFLPIIIVFFPKILDSSNKNKKLLNYCIVLSFIIIYILVVQKNLIYYTIWDQ